MRYQSIPESLDSVLQSFQSCFTAPTFGRFVALTTGWLLCRSRRWITRVAQASGEVPARHHSGFHRFFSEASWNTDDTWRALLTLLLEHLPKEITVIVDDTLCRRNGPRIFGTAMHYDGAAPTHGSKGASGSVACGHAWVVLAVHIPAPWGGAGIAVPVLAKMYRSLKRCPKAEYRKRSEIARDLVETLAAWLPDDRRLHLTGDREYACKTTLRELDRSIDFTGPMPMNALLYEPLPADYQQKRGRRRIKGPDLPNPSQLVAKNPRDWKKRMIRMYGKKVKLLTQDFVCLWYTATGTRLVRVVVTRDPKGNYEDRAFFSTRHTAGPKKIIECFAKRWMIEVSFREAKQAFGLAEPQNGWSRGKRAKGRPKAGPQPRGNRGRLAAERTAPFALITRGILVAWYLREDRWKQDVEAHKARSPWYLKKTTPSVDDMLNALRTDILARRLYAAPPRKRTLAEYRETLRELGIAA